MNSNRCVMCDHLIPEGSHVCVVCTSLVNGTVKKDTTGKLVINKRYTTVEEQIKTAVQGIVNSKGYYIIEFNHGYIEVKELDSEHGNDIMNERGCRECALR